MLTKKIPSVRELREMNPLKTVYDPFAYLPDYLGFYLVKLFLYTPITPNQISFFSYLLYLLAAFFIAIDQYVVLALVVFQIVLILDAADGALARVKNQTSFLGEYYECTFHETAPPVLFFALGSYLYVTLSNPVYIYLGAFILIARLIINSFGTSKQRIMYEHIRKEGKIPSNLIDGSSFLKEARNSFLVVFLNLITVLSSVPFSSTIIALGYIFGFLKYVFIFYFVYFSLIAIFKIIVELVVGFKSYGLK